MPDVFAQVNGLPILKGEITLPRVGTWHADFVLDPSDSNPPAAGTKVQITAGDLSLSGTVLRTNLFRHTQRMRVVAGAGQLYRTVCKPKMYQGVQLKLVLLDLLGAAGETLSNLADPTTLATFLSVWVQEKQGCIAALNSLLSYSQVPPVAWRFKPDGTFWVGPEGYPAIDSVYDAVLTSQNPQVGWLELGSDSLAPLVPGVTYRSNRIGTVFHSIQPAKLRSVAYLDS